MDDALQNLQPLTVSWCINKNLVFDLSNAFNTTQPHILAQQLIDFNRNYTTGVGVLDYHMLTQ